MVTSQYRKTEPELWGNGEKWRCGVWRRGEGAGDKVSWDIGLCQRGGFMLSKFGYWCDVRVAPAPADWPRFWLRLGWPGCGDIGPGTSLCSPPPVVATSCHNTMATIFICQQKRYTSLLSNFKRVAYISTTCESTVIPKNRLLPICNTAMIRLHLN